MKFDSSYLWSERHAKWIISSCASVFALLILYEVVSVFIFRYQIKNAEVVVAEPPIIKSVAIVEKFDTEIFGVYIPPNLSTEDIKESKLDVQLVGILFADNVNDSQVIIRSADGEELTYQVGDEIQKGAVIKRIMPNGLLVEHNGALERLDLSEDALKFEPPSESFED